MQAESPATASATADARVRPLRKKGKQVDCEPRFHGESYGWDVQFLYDGGLAYGRRYLMRKDAVEEAEAQLDPGLFVRVHRSHIVAIPHITLVRKEGDGAIIELGGPSPHRVPVSRAKIAEVKARLGLRRQA